MKYAEGNSGTVSWPACARCGMLICDTQVWKGSEGPFHPHCVHPAPAPVVTPVLTNPFDPVFETNYFPVLERIAAALERIASLLDERIETEIQE